MRSACLDQQTSVDRGHFVRISYLESHIVEIVIVNEYTMKLHFPLLLSLSGLEETTEAEERIYFLSV